MEKEKRKKQTAEMKLQDEHNCLSSATNQITKIMTKEVFGLK
jgi:hypothetical protein